MTYDKTTGRWLLKKAMDQAKDTKLFSVYHDPRTAAAHCVSFGSSDKSTGAADRSPTWPLPMPIIHDSQDVCFIGKEGCAGFFIVPCQNAPAPQGPFVDREGHVLGTHKGIWQYTIGQRRGLHLAGGGYRFMSVPSILLPIAWSSGPEQDLYSTILTARNINLITLPKLPLPMRLQAKIRSRQSGTVGHRHANGRRHAANSFRRAPAGHHKRAGGGFVRWRMSWWVAVPLGKGTYLANFTNPVV